MNKGKILVIDDDYRICRVLEEFLYKRGFDAKCTRDGAEAIELLKNEEFDLVLCDYLMAEVTGYDVTKSMDVLEKRPKIGIITGWTEFIKDKEREEMKVDFFINKPFDFSELDKKISDVIEAS